MNARQLTQAGLLVLSTWLVVAPPAGAAAGTGARLAIGLDALPLLLLVAAGLRRVRQWGAWVAIVLVPYFALSTGSMLVAPATRFEGAAFATLVAVVLFAGIATGRARG